MGASAKNERRKRQDLAARVSEGGDQNQGSADEHDRAGPGSAAPQKY